jgi:hypothetical protein
MLFLARIGMFPPALSKKKSEPGMKRDKNYLQKHNYGME